MPGHRDTSLKGRGDDAKWSKEPDYMNVIGYVVVDKYDFKFESMREMPQTPWLIEAGYSKSNSDYTDEIAHQKLEHKTEVVVRSQFFKHLHHDVYEGRLKVERLSDGKEFFINVQNFVTKPYWEDKNLLTAAEVGMYIAEDTRNGTKYLVFQRGTQNNYDGLVVGTWQEKEKYGKIYPQLVKKPMKPEFLKIIY